MKHNYSLAYRRVFLRPLEEKDIEELRVLRNKNQQYFNNTAQITPEQQKMSFEELQLLLTEVLPATNTVLLYVDAHTDTIIQRLIARGEGNEKIIPEMTKYIKNIRGTYRSVLRRAGASYVEINGEGGANYIEH